MKQKLLGRLAAAAVLLLSATTATAHDFEVDGIYYNKNSDGTSVSVTCEGPYSSAYEDEYVGIITIPAEVSLSDKTFLVSSIGSGAFGECGKISSVILPNTIKSVCNFAFQGCCGITNIDIPNSVTSIGSYAFKDCSGLTSIGLSNAIESIGERAFMDCTSLSRFIIPNNIKVINVGTFNGCCGLTSVEIPESVTSIGEFAFLGCSSLSSLIMPNSVTDLGDNAFQDCNNLTNVNISSSLTKISVAAFANCSKLISVVIPCSVTQIGGSAFNGCTDLRSITTLNPTPPTVESTTFYKVPSTCVLYVPAESVEAYRATYGWSDFTNIKAIPETNPEPEPEPAEDTDLSQYENVMYVESADGYVGSEVTLSLKMNNAIEAVGFQCDFYAPEGTEVALDEDGYHEIYLSTERTTTNRTNVFDFAAQPDSAIRILASSTKVIPFSGNTGEVATIKLNIGSDVADGDYPLILRKVIISDAVGNSYKVDYVKTTLSVSSYMLGDANGDGDVNIADFTAIANYILGKQPGTFIEKAADTNQDGEISVSDLSGLVQIILSGGDASKAPIKMASKVLQCEVDKK